MAEELEKFTTPHGETFSVFTEATNRILNEGVPFIIVDIKERKLSTKEGEFFLYTNTEGNIPLINTSGLGFYFQDTRFLSCYEFKINGRYPILLSSSAARNYMAHIELANTDIWQAPDNLIAEQDTINIRRKIILRDCLYERIRIKNYGNKTVKLRLDFLFNSDFSDIFEVRGQRRESRGTIMQPKFSKETGSLRFAYHGQDNVFRQTVISFSEQPDNAIIELDKTTVTHEIELPPQGRHLIELKIEPKVGDAILPKKTYDDALSWLKTDYEQWERSCTQIRTNNELFNKMIERGVSDIRALISKTENGVIFDAGIPWFTSPFGRDSLITANQILLLNYESARHCLEYLAKLQAKAKDDWRDMQPGKIMHELRRGELALSRQIPHIPYYGSADATPLFLILCNEYLKWSGDVQFIEELKPNILSALDWTNKWGDLDNDGFVEYKRTTKAGLDNQGWKDSFNSVMHVDGRKAEPPIALVEIQGYVYHAKISAANILSLLAKKSLARRLEQEANDIKKLFNEKFWMKEEKFFAMALDKNKKRVKSITSNPGHCLWSGIVDESKAGFVKDRLLSPDMFSGWGIRTLNKASINYNPMSYHNGTIWPHDNAIIAAGFKNYGFIEAAHQIITSLFDVAQHEPYSRLPELFCGFTRRGKDWPVEYPIACSPQAWASASVFMMLVSLLGLKPDATSNTLYIDNPSLPDWLDFVHLKNLRIGNAKIEIVFRKEDGVISFKVLEKIGKLKIIMEE